MAHDADVAHVDATGKASAKRLGITAVFKRGRAEDFAFIEVFHFGNDSCHISNALFEQIRLRLSRTRGAVGLRNEFRHWRHFAIRWKRLVVAEKQSHEVREHGSGAFLLSQPVYALFFLVGQTECRRRRIFGERGRCTFRCQGNSYDDISLRSEIFSR